MPFKLLNQMAYETEPRKKLYLITYGIEHEDKSYVDHRTVAAESIQEAERKARFWIEDFFADASIVESGGRCVVTKDGYEQICVDAISEYPTCEDIFRALEIGVGGRPELYRRPELSLR